jgi:hypothetical protein
MRAGIKACVKKKCVLSAVTLIFSAVDALSALTRPVDQLETNRGYFKGWVEHYLLRHLTTSLTASDLYGARCGIVHTYGPNSGLSRKGEAKTIVYRWRTGHKPDDPILAAYAHDALVVEVEALFEAMQNAVDDFQQRVCSDPDLRTRVETHIKSLLCYAPSEPISIVVDEEDSSL